MAFSPNGEQWYLVNATPDVTTQLAAWPEFHPHRGIRNTPIRGVLLTDAELDHTLGLLHLREGSGWSLHATDGVLACLRAGFDVLPTLGRYTEIDMSSVPLGQPLTLGAGRDRVEVRWLETGRETPLHTGSEEDVAGAVSALVLEVVESGRSVVYAPGVPGPSEALDAACRKADAIYFDGTFWTGDELLPVSGKRRDAFDMGHWPISGAQGSATYLAELPAGHIRYLHVNNTNPVLDPTSGQRAALRALGLDVAEDGEELDLA